MGTIRGVLDKRLLEAADRAGRRAKMNCSLPAREALHEHLTRLELCAKEERDRHGYARAPQAGFEARLWEGEAVW